MVTKTVEVPVDQIEVHANIGPGRVVRAVLTIEVENQAPAAGAKCDQWEKDFEELLSLAPINPFPVDDSREAIYGPDPDDESSDMPRA